jgi:glycosyltransferase involved in cell wall biosynthesis
MRILFAHNRYQTVGGEDLAARVVMQLVQRHGHTIELFEANNTRIEGLGEKITAAMRAVYSPDSRKSMAARIKSFRPDIVHVFNFFPLLSPSIHYACLEAGVPVVQKLSNFRLICPGALLLRDGRVCEKCVGKRIPWPGVRHACYRNSLAGSAAVAVMLATHGLLRTWGKTVSSYIARTRFSRDKFIQGGLPAGKIGIIPSFAPDPGSTGERSGGFALFAGRLSEEKGMQTLLSAWERMPSPPFRLLIAGDGPLREEVVRRTLTGRVEYAGTLSRAEIQTLLLRAALLVYPSVCYENFPLSIVEAFAAGVPVVASGMGAMSEIIEDRHTGLHFRPGDPDDLAAKIQWASGNTREMDRMSGEARNQYLSKYTPEQNYRILMDMYERVLGGKESPAGPLA